MFDFEVEDDMKLYRFIFFMSGGAQVEVEVEGSLASAEFNRKIREALSGDADSYYIIHGNSVIKTREVLAVQVFLAGKF